MKSTGKITLYNINTYPITRKQRTKSWKLIMHAVKDGSLNPKRYNSYLNEINSNYDKHLDRRHRLYMVGIIAFSTMPLWIDVYFKYWWCL